MDETAYLAGVAKSRRSPGINVDHESAAAVAALVDKARKSAQASAPRKHHLIPGFYLRNWAGNGRVRVTDLNDGTNYESAPDRVARETDFYSLADDELDPEEVPPLLVETLLSEIEGAAAAAFRSLLAGVGHRVGGGPTIEPTDKFDIAQFLAVQITRGRAHRAQARNMVASGHRVLYSMYTDDHIRQHLRDVGVDATDAAVAENRAFLDRIVAGDVEVGNAPAKEAFAALEQAQPLIPYLAARRWHVMLTPPVLVTCDEPVLRLGGFHARRSERSGVSSAGVVLFPLTPGRLLVLAHPGLSIDVGEELDHVETAEVNREILAATHRWAFDQPGRRTAERMKVPPYAGMAPMPEEVAVTGDLQPGDLLKWTVPTRWANTEHPPAWPVSRWWRGGWVDPFALDRLVPRDERPAMLRLPDVTKSGRDASRTSGSKRGRSRGRVQG